MTVFERRAVPLALNVGDKVQHAQCPAWKGVVVKLGPVVYSPTYGVYQKVYWKGFDSYDPEKVDWTWSFAMERQEP